MEDEFRKAIKDAERIRLWFPFILLGSVIFLLWVNGEDVFARPDGEAAYSFIIILGLIFLGIEVFNVKILLLKAEYREWKRGGHRLR